MHYPPDYSLTPQERATWSAKYGVWRARILAEYRQKQIARHDQGLVNSFWPSENEDFSAPDIQMVDLDIIEMFLETKWRKNLSLLEQFIHHGAPEARLRAGRLWDQLILKVDWSSNLLSLENQIWFWDGRNEARANKLLDLFRKYSTPESRAHMIWQMGVYVKGGGEIAEKARKLLKRLPQHD